MKCRDDSDEEWKERSDDSATAMFAKYKQPDSGQVLSNLFGSVGLCGDPYEVADSDVGGYRLILG
jgi:hypothetical protein